MLYIWNQYTLMYQLYLSKNYIDVCWSSLYQQNIVSSPHGRRLDLGMQGALRGLGKVGRVAAASVGTCSISTTEANQTSDSSAAASGPSATMPWTPAPA